MEKEYHYPLPRDEARSPKQALKKIRNTEREHLYIFKEGRQIRRFMGESDRITLPPEYLFEMKDAVIVHNHPKGHSFSREDIEAIVRFDARELILTTPDLIFRVVRPEGGWPLDFDTELTQLQYQSSHAFAKQVVNKLISTNEVRFSDKDAFIIHYLWIMFFELNGILYVRKKTI